MYRALIIISFVFWAGILSAQTSDILVSGTVYNGVDSTPVSKVYVGILNSADGAITDTAGHFRLSVSLIDTLWFNSLEFDDQFIPVSQIAQPGQFEIYLVPAVYNLGEVTINGFSKARFKHDFLTLQLPPDKSAIDLKIPDDFDYASLPSDEPIDMRGPGSGGGIGFGMLTKYQRQLKEFEEYKAQWDIDEQNKETIARKYSPAIIKKYVPLTDEQMEAFMKFCNMDKDFILQATEYEIGTAIKDCYLAYTEQQTQP